ncbi:MAG TPA: hypothetical protein VGF18_02875, partial [Candidatus Tumulicola sp.]
MIHHEGGAHCSGCAAILPLLARSAEQNLIVATDLAPPGMRSPARSATPIEDAGAPTTVYVARTIVTLAVEGRATAVAVRGATILAVGTLEAVTQSLEPGSFAVDRRYENDVIVPGLIEQHLHPLLGALSFASTIVAIEDWDVPERFSKAARDNAEYVARLQHALSEFASAAPDETFFTWGYHHYFHGDVYRPQLDALSPERPVVVWHRSCHELILNTAA